MSHAQDSQPFQSSPSTLPPSLYPTSPAAMEAWLAAELPDPARREGHANPQIRRLCELNEERKATRLHDCGSFILRRCPQGHEFLAARLNCGLAFCGQCAPQLMLDLYHRWQATLVEYKTAHPDAQFTMLDISTPLPRDRQAALATLDRSGSIPNAGPIWSYLVGYDQDILRLRVLVVGPQRSTADWQAIWGPTASIQATVYPIYELANVFLGELLKVDLPRSLTDRADQEVLFMRCHRFRARGIRRLTHAGGAEYISVVRGKDNTEKSNCFGTHRCPKCGQAATERSQWFSRGHSKPAPEQIRWRPLRS